MAADQKHIPTKRSKNKHKHTTITCFSFKCCFGLNSRVQKQDHLIDTPKNNVRISSDQDRARTFPISHIPMLKSSAAAAEVGSGEEIDGVVDEGVGTSGDDHFVAPQSQQVMITNNNKVHEMAKKNKNLSKSSRSMSSIKSNKNITTSKTWNNSVKLLHSVSLPPPPLKSEKSTGGGDAEKKDGEESIRTDQYLDPIVGAIIMTVTLIVMLIWGKLCAVICTAAWFYIIPRFRASNGILNVNKLKNSAKHIDVDSWEYKKKIVLEGLLERY